MRKCCHRWQRYDFAMNAVADRLAKEIGRYGYAEENT